MAAITSVEGTEDEVIPLCRGRGTRADSLDAADGHSSQKWRPSMKQ